MTRAFTILALTCFLVAGAAVTSILSRGNMQAADADLPAAVVARSPVSNREAKQDRLTVLQLATASIETPKSTALSEPERIPFLASRMLGETAPFMVVAERLSWVQRR